MADIVNYIKAQALIRKGYTPNQATAAIQMENLRRYSTYTQAQKKAVSDYYSSRVFGVNPTNVVTPPTAAPAPSIDVASAILSPGIQPTPAQEIKGPAKIQTRATPSDAFRTSTPAAPSAQPTPPPPPKVQPTVPDTTGIKPPVLKAPAPQNIENVPTIGKQEGTIKLNTPAEAANYFQQVFANQPQVKYAQTAFGKTPLQLKKESENLRIEDLKPKKLQIAELYEPAIDYTRLNTEQITDEYNRIYNSLPQLGDRSVLDKKELTTFLSPDTPIQDKFNALKRIQASMQKRVDFLQSRIKTPEGTKLVSSRINIPSEPNYAQDALRPTRYEGQPSEPVNWEIQRDQKEIAALTKAYEELGDMYSKTMADFNGKITFGKVLDQEVAGITRSRDPNKFLGVFKDYTGIETKEIIKMMSYGKMYDLNGKLTEQGAMLRQVIESSTTEEALKNGILPNLSKSLPYIFDYGMAISNLGKSFTDEGLRELNRIELRSKKVLEDFNNLPQNERTEKRYIEVSGELKSLEARANAAVKVLQDFEKKDFNIEGDTAKKDYRIDIFSRSLKEATIAQKEYDESGKWGKFVIGVGNWYNAFRNYFNENALERYARKYGLYTSYSGNIQDIGKEYVNASSETINAIIRRSSYPTIDKIASAAAGRPISSSQFAYRKKEGGWAMGDGFLIEGPSIVANMIPMIVGGRAIQWTAGKFISSVYSAASIETKIAATVKQASRFSRMAEAAKAGGPINVWRAAIQAEVGAANSGLAKLAIGALENRIPTFVATYATSYPGIYRATVKDLYANKVSNAESKAKGIAAWNALIEAVTEGFFPDIAIGAPNLSALPKSSVFGQMISRFGGKKLRSTRDYMDLLDVIGSGLSPQAKSFLAKRAFNLKQGANVLFKAGRVAYKTGLSPGEGFEEIAAGVGNHFVDLAYSSETGKKPEELNFESIVNDFVGGAFLTLPATLVTNPVAFASYYKEDELQSAFRVALNPEIFKSKVYEMQKNGDITQDQAVKALAKVEFLHSIIKNPVSQNLVEEAQFMQDRDSQFMYFRSMLNSEGIQAKLLDVDSSKLSEEKRNELLATAEEINKDIANFERRASLYQNMTDEDKKKHLMKHVEEGNKLLPYASLSTLKKMHAEQVQEKGIAKINKQIVFPLIEGVMDSRITKLEEQIAARETAIQDSIDAGELNPLMTDTYEAQDQTGGLQSASLVVDSPQDAADMLLQMALNPDTQSEIPDLFQKLVMIARKDATRKAIIADYVAEARVLQKKPNLTENDLSESQLYELKEILESHTDQIDAAEQEIEALQDAVVGKFSASLQEGKFTREQLLEELFGDASTLFFNYMYFGEKGIMLTHEQMVNFPAFQRFLQGNAQDRLDFITKSKEQDDQAAFEEAQVPPVSAEPAAEVVEEEEIEEEAPKEVSEAEFSPSRLADLTDYDQRIKIAALKVLQGIAEKRSQLESKNLGNLIKYAMAASSAEQAIARVMFAASLYNQDTTELNDLLTELFTDPSKFLLETEKVEQLNQTKVGRKLMNLAESQFAKFAPVEPVGPPVEAAPLIEPPKPTKPKTLLGKLGMGLTYAISYSNSDLAIENIDYDYSARAEKIMKTVEARGPKVKVRVMDLFSFFREYVPNGEKKLNRMREIYEEFATSNLAPHEREARKKELIELFPPGLLKPSMVEYHVDKVILGSEHGLIDKKKKSKFEDTNIILGVGVEPNASGEYQSLKFDNEGMVNESGNGMFVLTFARDLSRPEMYKSAVEANKIRKHVDKTGGIDALTDISAFYNYTDSEDLSVGVSLVQSNVDDVIRVEEAMVPEPVVVEPAPVPTAEEAPKEEKEIDEEIKELESEKSALEAEKDSLAKELQEAEKLLQEVKEANLTKAEAEKAAQDAKELSEDIDGKVEEVIDQEVKTEELEEAAKEEGKTKEEVKKEVIDKVKEELSTGKNTAIGAKIKTIVAKVAKVLRKIFYTFILASFLYSSVAFVDYKQTGNINNTIETSLSILPDSYRESALRAATKAGLYDPSVNEVIVGEDMNETVRITSAAETGDTSDKAAYVKENTYTEIIGKVPDKHHKARKGAADSLLMYRNQFFNENGFNYLTAPIRSQTKEHEKRYGTLGVAHFLILDDQAVDLTPASSDAKLKEESDKFKKTRIGNDIKADDYVPVFTRKGDVVNLKYKKAKDVTAEDLVITKLLQYNFADINFDSKKSAQHIGFAKGVYHLTTHSGKDVVSLLFTDAGKNAYSRFSGGSAVFIFKDTLGNVIVRDFSGSTEMIGREGKRIAQEFNISPNDITLGFFDAGSYSAKPAAKGGVLEMDQYKGYNILHPNSGGGLLLPTGTDMPINEAMSVFGLLGLLAMRRKKNEDVSEAEIEDVLGKIKERLTAIDTRLSELGTKLTELQEKKALMAEKAKKEAPVPAAPVQPSDIEAKKADIEKRREEELKSLTRTTLYGTKENGEIDTNITITIEKGNPIQIDDIENSNEIIISDGKYVGRARRNSQGKWDYKIGAGGSSQLSDIELFESLQKNKIRHGKVVDTFNYAAELDALKTQTEPSVEPTPQVPIAPPVTSATKKEVVIKKPFTTEGTKQYFFMPNEQGVIPSDYLSSTFKEGAHALVLIQTSPTTAVFRVADNATATVLMNRRPWGYKDIVEDIEGWDITGDVDNLKFLQEGELVLRDGNWVVSKKAVVFAESAKYNRKFNEEELRERLEQKAGSKETPSAPPVVEPQVVDVPPVVQTQASGANLAEFNYNAIIAHIKNSKTIAEPTKLGYRINGLLMQRQSSYNAKEEIEDTEDNALLKASVVTGDFVDAIGRDVLIGKTPKSKQAYIDAVKAKQGVSESVEVSDKIYMKLIMDFTKFRDAIVSEGGHIFTDTLVFYSMFKEPRTIDGVEYHGVAGVPDIIIMLKDGSVHMVDLKNIKFAGMSNAKENFKKRERKWKTQQSTYTLLATGLIPKIESTNILGISSSYSTDDGNIQITSLELINMGIQDETKENSNIPYVGKIAIDTMQLASQKKDFVAKNHLNFVSNLNNPISTKNNECNGV